MRCGLSAAEYFAAVRRTAESIRIPQSLDGIRRGIETNPLAVENDFAQANPGIPRSGFRVSSYPDGALQEVRICFDKSLVAQPCTGAAECTRLIKIVLLPAPR